MALKSNSRELNILIGGAAGAGMQVVGYTIGKAFTRLGQSVFLFLSFESRIKGGHSFARVRVKEEEVLATREVIDILVALNQETIGLHSGEVSKKGIIIYDGSTIKVDNCLCPCLNIPFENIAAGAGNKLYANSVAAGAIFALTDLDIKYLEGPLSDSFGSKDEKIISDNLKAARLGYEKTKEELKKNNINFSFNNLKIDYPRLLLSGNEAIGLGALASGCKFYTGYPMTPSTGLLTFLAQWHDQFGVLVEQAEDEIAAINMAVGASYAGIRSMTGTSGGGFCLMTEGLGLAAMMETPIVIMEGQRVGPSTGLPTRSEQGDLRFCLHAAQGDFPRFIFAPKHPLDGFYLTRKAFELSQKYQVPAILLTDQYYCDSYFTAEDIKLDNLEIKNYLLTPDELKNIKEYKRYQLTDTGVSPRTIPFASRHLVCADSDEHGEEGHITEDLQLRKKMQEKRMKKLENMAKEMEEPETFLEDDADTVLIGWGSSYGALKEAVLIARENKIKLGLVHFSQLWPLPIKKISQILDKKKTIAVENNYSGQFYHLLREQTLKSPSKRINKYDGLPFTADYILKNL